jgi:hypothetical protein
MIALGPRGLLAASFKEPMWATQTNIANRPKRPAKWLPRQSFGKTKYFGCVAEDCAKLAQSADEGTKSQGRQNSN